MLKLYGVFEVAEGSREADFLAAFVALRDHLLDVDLITGGRMLRRTPHENYESDPPRLSHVVELDFATDQMAEACWDYIQDPGSAGRPIHHAMIILMGEYRFALYESVD